MRLDPPGFTGPPTSNDQSYGNDDSSSSSEPPSRLEHRIPRTHDLRQPGSPRIVLQGLARRWPRDRDSFPAATACYCFDTVQDRPETRNATAFHVSYGSVSRSEVRACARTDPSILDETRQGSRSRPRCNDHEPRHGLGERARDDREEYKRNVHPRDRFASTSRRFSRDGSENARAKRRTARGPTVFQEHVDLPPIPSADAKDAPSADAFVHTAHYDEDAGGRDAGVSRAASTHENCLPKDRLLENCPLEGHRRKPKTRRDGHEKEEILEEVESVDSDAPISRIEDHEERKRLAPRDGRIFRLQSARRRRSDYTAQFQEPTTSWSRNHDNLAINGPTKVSNPRGAKYGLLFILYLLAWPLVCSTNPSGQFASDFAQSPSLGFTENLPQHNVSQISALLSASLAKQQQHHQQQQQQQQQQHHRQTEKQHRAREQYVQDGEYGGDGHRRGGHDEEEQRREQQQEQREERETEESSYQDQEILPEAETMHPYNEYNWEVNQINPWLSACDLAGPAPADLQGSCGPPEVPKNCPAACAPTFRGDGFLEVIEKVKATERSRSGSSVMSTKEEGRGSDREKSEGVRMAPEQCLFYLEESHKRDICRDDFGRTSTRSFLTPRENRYWFMSGLRLRHCCEHAVVNALAPGKGGPLENVLNGGQKCTDALDKLLLVDALAARLHCEFEEVLARYDCGQPYSVIFNCTHCKEAYRKWVCSSLVPYFAHGGPQDLDSSVNSRTGSRLRPCRSFCQSVEQRCPYLLPGDRAPAYPTQYAGEPTFLCRDPNIPETGEQSARALHSGEEDECCFHACFEERPEAGICANCTDREPRKRGRSHDPPTAPHCEINPIQPASTGAQYPQLSTDSTDGELEDESSTPSTNLVQQQQRASLCGSGGVGSIPSVSSSDRPSPSILPQLLWLCSLLASVFSNVRSIPVFWIPRAFARFAAAFEGGWRSGRSKLTRGWLRRCWRRRVSHVDGCHGAGLSLEKRAMVERRCRGWWCWCWCWWWWRWRRSAVGRVRWKLRAGESPGRRRDDTRGPARSRKARDSFCDRRPRVRHWTRHFGEFAVKWRWWWWWLYRWWRSRRTRISRTGSSGLAARRNPRASRRGEPRGGEDGRKRKDIENFREDAWPLGRRHLRLSSRKDPP